MTDRLLTLAEIAQMLGVQPSTLSAYKSRGQMPPPDKQFGRTPLWFDLTIEAWRLQRKKAPPD